MTDIEKVMSAILNGTATPVSEHELVEIIDCNSKEKIHGLCINGMVFLPSGRCYLLPDD